MIRVCLILIGCMISLSSWSFAQAKELNNKGDYVVILHGIARSSSHMSSLSKYLHQAGYDVLNLDYPSTDHKIETLTRIIHQKILLQTNQNKKIHFVGYSMGGLMVRALIHQYSYQNLGRVVQLAPPNSGSEIADFLQDNWLYEKIYGPAGQQLMTDQKDVRNLFGEVNYELGIIAGNFTIDPISSSIIPGDDDGKVAIARTKLQGMKDHIVMNASHTFFPSNKQVHKQVLYFLRNGQFQH